MTRFGTKRIGGLALADGTRAGDNHRVLRDYQRRLRSGTIDLLAHDVVQRRGPCEDYARAQHRAQDPPDEASEEAAAQTGRGREKIAAKRK